MKLFSAFIVATQILVATPETPPIPNPCEGPASEACESALADKALYWEATFLEERLAHLNTISACNELLNVPPPQVEESGANIFWISAAIGAIVASIAGTAAVTYAVSQ